LPVLDGTAADRDAELVTTPRNPQEELVPVSLGVRRGLDPAIFVALVIVVVLVGVFGRLVPKPAAVGEPGRSPAPSGPAGSHGPVPAVRLVSPGAGVVLLRSTEVLVRGVADSGIRRIDVMVSAGGQPIGQAELDVTIARQINGLVELRPPSHRTAATLEIRAAGESDVLAQVTFLVEAGALLLPRDPSGLHGRAGGVLIVDVFVYGRLREVRGLLTGGDGHLIATGSTMLSGPGSVRGGPPRTIALELAIPTERLPSRARLHILGFDLSGTEVEHIDANVILSN
jgi:hypothetical protein